MSIKEAVETSGLSDSTIRRAIISGELKANKKGKWIIKSQWLEKYLTS
jgi:excisionase family DNA binding protein